MRSTLRRLLLLLAVALLAVSTSQAQSTRTGQVLGAPANTPLAGATITIKGTKTATASDENGKFSLGVSNGNILQISSVGYTTVELTVAEGANLVATLLPTDNNLNEVIVTGYSSQRRKDITGSVTIVKVDDLQSTPATSAENQLQGRAAGVNVINNSQPGSVATVRIRGYASFTGNDPLYVVDGVPATTLLGLVPDDIETMQVLKDAAAASIYGSRASNGVIIITTKKGKIGPAKVAYSTYYGIQDPGKGYTNMLNPQEFADLTWLVAKNTGQTPNSPQYGNGAAPVLPDFIRAGELSGVGANAPEANPDLYDLNYDNLGDPNYNPYLIVPANKAGTNWWNELTRTAPISNHNITISGANADKSRYLASFNYLDQQGILIENYYKRYGARVNTEFNVKNNIRIGENLQLFFSDANGSDNNTEQSEILDAHYILPIIPVYTIRDGDYAGTKGNGLGTTDNPIAKRVRKKNNRAYTMVLLGNVYAEVDFLKHFTARTSFGGTYGTQDSRVFPSIEYEGAENNRNPTFTRNFGKYRAYTFTNQLSYKNTIGKHAFAALVGAEAIEEYTDGVAASRSNYFNYFNYPFISLNSGTANQLASGNPLTTALFSLFGKVDYAFNDKYIVGVTLRRDGSSRFGSEKRYGTFPAASLGWRVSQEGFMQNISWLTDLKIRGSYGKMGNQRINAANQFTQFSTALGASSYDLNGTSTTPLSGFYLSFIGNIQGQWEVNTTSNIGFDALLFDNKTEINFDLYNKKTDKLLFPVEQLATSGGTAALNPPFFNVASMKNWGIDLSIDHRETFGKFKLNATVTLTTYKNQITKIADGTTFFDYNSPLNEQNRIGGTFTRNAVGQAINSYFGYEVVGIFKDAAAVSAAPTQTDAAPGRFQYRDANGDKQITPDDRVFFGNPNPDYSIGFNLKLNYSAFDFTAFLYGVKGRDGINYSRFTTDFFQSNLTNKSKEALYNSWTPDRPNATVPIQENTSTFSTNTVPNSYYKEDGSYLRLRNVSLGYTIPASLTNRIKIDKFRIYIQAVNLFTITNYTGLDPEIISSDDRAAGIDAGVYPAVKQFLIGANINF